MALPDDSGILQRWYFGDNGFCQGTRFARTLTFGLGEREKKIDVAERQDAGKNDCMMRFLVILERGRKKKNGKDGDRCQEQTLQIVKLFYSNICLS
jgi:hypothetical protein